MNNTTNINRQINEASTEDSPPVMAYRLGKLEEAVSSGFLANNAKLDALVTNFATKADSLVLDKRITDLESDRKWIVRLVVGAVTTSLLALIGIGLKLNP